MGMDQEFRNNDRVKLPEDVPGPRYHAGNMILKLDQREYRQTSMDRTISYHRGNIFYI